MGKKSRAAREQTPERPTKDVEEDAESPVKDAAPKKEKRRRDAEPSAADVEDPPVAKVKKSKKQKRAEAEEALVEEAPAEEAPKKKKQKRAEAAVEAEQPDEDAAAAKEARRAAKRARRAAAEAEQEPAEADGAAEKAAPEAEATGSQRSVFVMNLNWETTAGALADFFRKIGPCEARIVNDKHTGYSRGFGFVDFERAEDAREALTLDERKLAGRPIRVKFAETQPDGKGAVEGPPEGCTAVVANGLGEDVTEDAVWEHFSACPGLNTISVMTDSEGKSRGFAFLNFETTEQLAAAMELHGSDLGGSKISLRYKSPRTAQYSKSGKGKGKGKGSQQWE